MGAPWSHPYHTWPPKTNAPVAWLFRHIHSGPSGTRSACVFRPTLCAMGLMMDLNSNSNSSFTASNRYIFRPIRFRYRTPEKTSSDRYAANQLVPMGRFPGATQHNKKRRKEAGPAPALPACVQVLDTTCFTPDHQRAVINEFRALREQDWHTSEFGVFNWGMNLQFRTLPLTGIRSPLTRAD
jgi:hypothetical protein